MPVDPNVFNNIKTFADYRQIQDEFEQRQALARAQQQMLGARASYLENKQPNFADQVGAAAIRVAQGGQDASDIAMLQANNALHPKSNIAGLGLVNPSFAPSSSVPLQQAPVSQNMRAATVDLFGGAPDQTTAANFKQALSNPPQNKGGVVTIPLGDEANDMKPNNPYAYLNGGPNANPQILHGADYLKTLDNDRANIVKLIGDGAEKSTTVLARLPGAERQSVLSQVVQYNPNYSANQFGGNKEFGYGKLGNQIRSFNTSISHLATLSDLADQLGNGDIKIFNRAAQSLAEQTGNPAPLNFDAAKQIVGAEVVKAIVGAGGGVAERKEAADIMNRANSPAQLKGAIDSVKELMRGQLDNLRIQYKGTTGKDDFDSKLSPEALQVDHPVAPTNYSKQDILNEIMRREKAKKK